MISIATRVGGTNAADLLITFTNSTDQVRVLNAFVDNFGVDSARRLPDQWKFADGVAWNNTALKSRSITQGTIGADKSRHCEKIIMDLRAAICA
jgi:hypothetical protein